MKLSITGIVFSLLFLFLSGWCVISALRGAWEATALIVYVTMPLSWVIGFFCMFMQSILGMSNAVTNWVMVTLDIIFGILEFYFWGWFLERPLRR